MAAKKRPDTTPLAASIDDFLLSARAKRLSPRTVSFFSTTCQKVLLPFCERHGIKDLAQLKQSDLERLAVELQEQDGAKGPRSPFTGKAYLKGINQFLSWARKGGEAVAAKAEMPKTPKRDIDVLSRAEIQDLEDAAEVERDKLIIRVLADTAARLDELTRLRVGDIYERDRKTWVRFRGKGDKDRVVHLFPRVYSRLKRSGESCIYRASRPAISFPSIWSTDHQPLTPAWHAGTISRLSNDSSRLPRMNMCAPQACLWISAARREDLGRLAPQKVH